MEQRLLVAIRPRPLGAGEEDDATVRFSGESAEVLERGAWSLLPFDRVFRTTASNEDVYNDVAAPIVAAALRGINGSVAAYGQTGSGALRNEEASHSLTRLLRRLQARRAACAARRRTRASCSGRCAPPPCPHAAAVCRLRFRKR